MARSIDDLTFRRVRDDESDFRAYAEAVSLGFHESVNPANLERWRMVSELDRTWIAEEAGRIVGTSATHSFAMSLPGGAEAACGGLTAVGVAPDWRRRGLLTRMIRWHLDDSHERGEPFAALYASESPIYGRYGYGIAAPMIDIELERPWARLVTSADLPDVRLVEADALQKQAPPIYDQARTQRGGMMTRSQDWWRSWLAFDPADDRDGYSPRMHALVPGRGYAVYRTKSHWVDNLPAGTLLAMEVTAVDPEAYAALWQFLFGIDLIGTIRSHMEPADVPLLSLVENHQRCKTRGGEDLYLRLVDVGAALSARSYDVDDTLTFEVADPYCPWNAGTWTLETGDGEGSCRRSERTPDLALDVRELAAICLGGVSASHHVWAGRIIEHAPAAAARADRLFHTPLAPWNPFEF